MILNIRNYPITLQVFILGNEAMQKGESCEKHEAMHRRQQHSHEAVCRMWHCIGMAVVIQGRVLKWKVAVVGDKEDKGRGGGTGMGRYRNDGGREQLTRTNKGKWNDGDLS